MKTIIIKKSEDRIVVIDEATEQLYTITRNKDDSDPYLILNKEGDIFKKMDMIKDLIQNLAKSKIAMSDTEKRIYDIVNDWWV